MHENIAVLIPCYNESPTIVKVIQDFHFQLPQATIYVYDNGSTDDSVALAKSAGAKVMHVAQRGKGQVVRRFFSDIEADIYVMVDGDATYDAASVNQAIHLLQSNTLDMVVCTRRPQNYLSFPKGHQLGNRLFTWTVNFLFGHHLTDIFSGYRVFSRRFVKSFPAVSKGFEIEAEMTIHSMQLSIPIAEIPTPYQERPPGSKSKLHTIRDGFRILKTILMLFISTHPMICFGGLAILFTSTSLILSLPIIMDFIQTGLVPRIPTAVLSTSLILLASLCLACGLVLDGINRIRLESKRFCYLLLAPIK